MKIRILAIEYPDEAEKHVSEILDSVFFSNMLKRIAQIKFSEVTAPYNGEFDAFVNDVLCLLISHDKGTEELIKAISDAMPHLPELIKEFERIREKLEEEKK